MDIQRRSVQISKKWKFGGKGSSKGIPIIEERKSIMKRSNMWSTKVKYWNIKEREHTDGLNEWATG